MFLIATNLPVHRIASLSRILLLLIGVGVYGCSARHPRAQISTTDGVRAPTAVLPPPTQERGSSRPADPSARLQRAEQYVASGETYAAIEQLEVAREAGDGSERLVLRLAELYDRLGESESAAMVLASSVSSHAASANLRLALCHELDKAGRFAEAADIVRPLLAKQSTLSPDIRQALARALLLADDTEGAGKLIPWESADPEWLTLRGMQAQLMGQPKVAADAFTRLLALKPHNGWYSYLLGRAWLAAGVPDKALAALSEAARLPDAPPQAAIGAARLLTQAARFDEAAMLIQRIGNMARTLPAYWQIQGLLAQKGRQPVFAQIARGYAAYHSGDPWLAEAIWRSALPQAQTEDAWALYTAMINSAEQRQDRIALPYATAAAKRFPNDYYILKKRAELLLNQNAQAEALAVAERLSPLEPPEQAGQAADLLARIALSLGKADLLQRSVQREREQVPRNPASLLHLIEWQRRQQWSSANMKSLLTLCQEAISLAPDNAEAYFRAGEVLKSLGRPEEAMAMLRHALMLSPRLHDGSLNALLSQLEQRQGLLAESRYELKEVKRLNELRDPWATQMELFYRDRPTPTLGEWKTLGRLALDRHDPWVALCATTRAIRLAPQDPAILRMRAAALSRLGRADEALASMQAAHQLQGERSGH